MDDLLGEFLTETAESLDTVEPELVRFEAEPNNQAILANIFRLVHTIKGTCGFLGLPRLAGLAHAGETLLGTYRDGAPVTPDGVSAILVAVDRIKEILADLEQTGNEPDGSDADMIGALEALSIAAMAGDAAPAAPEPEPAPAPESERELKPGEVPLDELERAFQEAAGPDGFDFSVDDWDADTAPGADGEPAAVPATDAAPAPAAQASAEATRPRAAPSAASEASDHDGPIKQQTLRVSVETLEELMTSVSELVLTRNQLLDTVRRNEDSDFKIPLQRLSNVTAELQESVMKTRMQPIGNAWQKLPRIVRDLARELGKKITLDMTGADTELDRQVLEMIKDPLTHMVRNSADHGLETTQDRIKAGKAETGQIKLSAHHEGGHIIVAIADDGKGLDAEKIREKVLEKGLADERELDQLSEEQIQKYIFAPGFSTAAAVTSVSGRGVGMDVARTNIELIGGNIELKSKKGVGTVVSIKIPLTLAIVPALIVEAGGQRFAVPQLSIVELVHTGSAAGHRIETINEAAVLRLRNKLLPLVDLSKLLGRECSMDGHGENAGNHDIGLFVVVMQVGPQTFGMVVDGVFQTEEIVVKPMSSRLRNIPVFSGNTILGDGAVIMILDPTGISNAVGTLGAAQKTEETAAAEAAHEEAAKRTSLLVFRAGDDEQKAVPLSLITRLEEIGRNQIEHSNGCDLVQYRGRLMPLVFIDETSRGPGIEGPRPVLVFTDQDRSLGLVVDEIIDIVSEPLHIELSDARAGRIGTAVIRGKATAVIDVGHYLPTIFNDEFGTAWEESGPEPTKLLLVDDSSFFRNLLEPLLKTAGYQVTLATSAVEALALKEQGRTFDIIISDIEMPEMDGITFAQELRRDAAWGAKPIIALSSHTSPDLLARTRAAGFTDYVGKFDREGLVSALKDCGSDTGKAA